ncbi:hypothetical protein SprV_0301000900 [Sparganum proliferum]
MAYRLYILLGPKPITKSWKRNRDDQMQLEEVTANEDGSPIVCKESGFSACEGAGSSDGCQPPSPTSSSLATKTTERMLPVSSSMSMGELNEDGSLSISAMTLSVGMVMKDNISANSFLKPEADEPNYEGPVGDSGEDRRLYPNQLKCGGCDSTFVEIGSLKRHVDIMHPSFLSEHPALDRPILLPVQKDIEKGNFVTCFDLCSEL